jgi:hypothetical protein
MYHNTFSLLELSPIEGHWSSDSSYIPTYVQLPLRLLFDVEANRPS